ncbi:hypothetical protein HPP92_005457 [Vanilla planifolia]|uniref:BHLH domain-containing protein n=1 Tax=Vanilla planifolia TaxID=51239 RepID=A0A835RYT8_VANPL|nr:hypothetical protein HPP92_005457 [Vanilla planifolia]
MNASTNRSWMGCISSQVDGLIAQPMVSYQGQGKTSSILLIYPSRLMGNMSADNLNVGCDNTLTFADRSAKYRASEAVFMGENLLQFRQSNHSSFPSHGIEAYAGSFSTPGPVTLSSASVSFCGESNISLPQSALTISNCIENIGSGPQPLGQPLGLHSISTVPVFLPPSPIISPVAGHGKVQNFRFHGMANGLDFTREANNEMGYSTSMDSQNGPNSTFVAFSSQKPMKTTNESSCPHDLGTTDLQNLPLSCFSEGSYLPLNKAIGMLTNVQLQNHVFRARRGQATDPHSIAERVRREKIAERMKNLQELVPNSNKNDRASMLDEIIDYVKFLQLQVKVLSISRLGAADADASYHRCSNRGVDLSESEENLAFEHEVVKLMEADISTAMQYLQNKGLCLMPIALATAISNQKGSVASIPSDRQKLDTSKVKNCGDEVNQSSGSVVQQEDFCKPMGDQR